MLKFHYLKTVLLVTVPLAFAACGVDSLSATEQALSTDPHSLPGQQARYGLLDATGFGTNRVAVVFDGINDKTAFETDFNNLRAALGLGSCTQASGCLKLVNQTGGSTLPSDDSKRADAALTAASLAAGSPNAQVTVIVPSSRSTSDLTAALTTMYAPAQSIAGAVFAFGPAAPSDQGAITTLISGHSAIPVGSLAGLYSSGLVVQVEPTQISPITGADLSWFAPTVTPDVGALGHNILRPDGSSVDSEIAPVGIIMGSGMTRAQINALPAGDFTAVVGITKGVFNL
jgi:hypothetical protein